MEEGIDWLHEALERAPDAAGARATALTWLAVFTSVRSGFQRGGQLFEESIALHERVGNRDGQARALAILGFWRANQNDRQGAAEAIDRAMALTRQRRNRYFVAFALLMASMTASLMADPALARERATDSVKLFTELADRRGAGYARCVLAECLIQEGKPREGLALLRVCVRDFEALLDRWGLLISTGSAALAHAALGDWSRAAIAAGVADSLSERVGGLPAPAVQGPVDTVMAKIAAELGATAQLLRDTGRTVGRGDQIAAALALAAEPAPPQPQHDLPLTRREREIARLIAAGMTNRQIAERLFIAQRTVDTHVAHILAKLGCSNRAQAAAVTSTRMREEIRMPGT
jgi:DNA-binding CsgD family transcriptional regulator